MATFTILVTPRDLITPVVIDTTVTITVGALTRTFIMHVPAGTRKDAGLLLLFHGGTGNGANFRTNIGMDGLADQYKFITIYPNAVDGIWTDGRTSTVGGPDDISFVNAIVSYMNTYYEASTTKVFASGVSNGGLFCHWLVANSPNTVAAIAPVAANVPESFIDLVINPKPIIMFNGTADPLMLYLGGIPTIVPGATDSMVSSIASISTYAQINGCTSYTDTALPDLTADGCTVSRKDFSDCSLTPTTLYTIFNGGHTWPSGTGTGGAVGLTTFDISANQIMTEMFALYGLYNDPTKVRPSQMSVPIVSQIDRTSLLVTRAAAPVSGNSPISSYDLRYSTNESTWTTITSIGSTHTITGLLAGVGYYVQTRAINANGAGDWSLSTIKDTVFNYTLYNEAGSTTISAADLTGMRVNVGAGWVTLTSLSLTVAQDVAGELLISGFASSAQATTAAANGIHFEQQIAGEAYSAVDTIATANTTGTSIKGLHYRETDLTIQNTPQPGFPVMPTRELFPVIG